MRVRATQTGYLGGKRREPGEEFDLDGDAFSPRWMTRVPFGGKGDHDHNGEAGGTAPPVDGLAAMTVIALKALAKERGIDLGRATAKAAIIEALEGGHDGEHVSRPVQMPPLSAEDRIKQASDLTGRTDIATVEEADAILAAAGGPDPASDI